MKGSELLSMSSRAYRVPTSQPEADGTLEWTSTTVVVAEVSVSGATGLGWTYGSAASALVIESEISPALMGRDVGDIAGAHEVMVRACRNLGRPGVVSCAVSAVDVALWDCKARMLGVSLSELFGRCRPDAPIYGSGGFTNVDDRTMAAQLEQWAAEWGIPRVKIKVGESWGAAERRDLERTGLARRTIGGGAELYVDANGGYRRKQAVRMGKRFFDDYGVTWFEEPVSSDDLDGLRAVRDQLPLDVAAGEYGYDEAYFARMVVAQAVDCLQVDVTRCGGYTSWLRAAAVAGAHGLDVSAHCAPNLHAHVALGVPNLRHVEYFYDHYRLDAMLFDGILAPDGGALRPDAESPGHGMSLRGTDAEAFRVC